MPQVLQFFLPGVILEQAKYFCVKIKVISKVVTVMSLSCDYIVLLVLQEKMQKCILWSSVEVEVATAQQRWNTLSTGSHDGGKLLNA